MKRFHVHVVVPSLDESVRFYSGLFGAEPTVLKGDYAKWMLEDPRVNFAISSRGGEPGVNHLGFQVDTEDELASLREQAFAASVDIVDQTGAQCCYASSNKYWAKDPAGVPWETYHTLGTIPVYGMNSQTAEKGEACCMPLTSTPAADNAKSSCC